VSIQQQQSRPGYAQLSVKVNPVRIAKSMINEETRRLFDRCIKNARSLLESAKDLSEREDRLHISHHLTILALEEVGKAAIILIHSDGGAAFGCL